MIVRSNGSELELITQPDHAQLARRVMEHSRGLRDHPRRDRILHAVGEHDIGWAELDAEPTVNAETGEIYDFIHAPVAARQAVWPRAVARLSSDPWVAALVAQHALTAYDRYRSDPEWTSFFDEMTRSRDDSTARAEGRLEDLLADYMFVRLGDLISLSFCVGFTGEQQFGEYTVNRTADGVEVSPWLFEDAAIAMEVQARVIPGRAYPSDEALREAMAAAKPVVLRGSCVRR
jgi:hypothetical protein